MTPNTWYSILGVTKVQIVVMTISEGFKWALQT